MSQSANWTGLTNEESPAGASGRGKGGREGGEVENISDIKACAGVPGILWGGDGGTDRSQGSQFYSGHITPKKVGIGGWSMRCAGCLRGTPALASSRRLK